MLTILDHAEDPIRKYDVELEDEVGDPQPAELYVKLTKEGLIIDLWPYEIGGDLADEPLSLTLDVMQIVEAITKGEL